MWEMHSRVFWSVARREVGILEKYILFGKVPGKMERGRFQTRRSDIIKARMGSVVRAASQAQDRDRWRFFSGATQS